jgi:thiol-disulfide isomerase/thioredoxin
MRFYLSILSIVGLLVAATSVQAQVPVRGILLGADGEPMIQAHLVVDEGPVDTTMVVAVDSAGRFAFTLPASGGYGVYAMGVHHETQEFPLIAHDQTPLDLEIQLRAIDVQSSLDQAQVIGDFNDFSTEKGAAVLTKQEDGMLTGTVQARSDTVAYQVIGVKKAPGNRPARIAGIPASRYHLDAGGPFWDLSSDYVSVFDEAAGGKTTLTFDPSRLPDGDGAFALRASREPVQRVVSIYSEVEELERNIGIRARSNRDSIRNFIECGQESFKQRIQQEDDPIVRRWMLLRYFDELQPTEADSTLARQALHEVPPTSPLWSFEAWSSVGASNIIASIARRAGAPSKVRAYMDRVVEEHSDSDVHRHFRYAAVRMAHQNGDEMRKRTYYDQMMTHHPGSRQAEKLRRKFSKERAVQPDRPVPDFSFVALEDSAVTYTDEQLEGTVYLIDFWGTWCGPCIEEMPYLHEAYRKYHDRGFKILSVAFRDGRSDIRQFRRNRYPMPWLHTLVEREDDQQVRAKFELTGFPRPILIDETGMIIAVDDQLRGEKLLSRVKETVEGE